MDSSVINCLFDAVCQKDVETARQLLNKHRIDVNTRFYGHMPRFDTRFVSTLGIWDWAPRGGFSTLLSQAVAERDLAMVDLLLDYKADLSAEVSNHQADKVRIITLAAQVSCESIITCLSRRGAVERDHQNDWCSCHTIITMRMWNGTLNPLVFEYGYLCPPQWSIIDHFRMPHNMRTVVESIAVARDASTASVLAIMPNELLFLVFELL